VKYENDFSSTIKVVGDNFDEPIKTDKNYIILAKEGWSEKYGFQYDLVSINEEIDFSKIENQEAFLKVFCTDGQIKEMYEILGNPLEAISNHDIESLTKVKGIGEYTANCIIERFERHKDNSKAYIELADYNLTPVLIAKLVKHYSKVAKVIDVVKNTPYKLVGVSGIGFKKADEIALKTGFANRYQFSKSYRQFFGTSPGSVRKKS
jgi:ribosomal protein S13